MFGCLGDGMYWFTMRSPSKFTGGVIGQHTTSVVFRVELRYEVYPVPLFLFDIGIGYSLIP